MREKARERGLLHPVHPGTNERYEREHKKAVGCREEGRGGEGKGGGKSLDAGHERPCCWIA